MGSVEGCQSGEIPGSGKASTLQMRFSALATDYDGTLARHGVANEMELKALTRLRESGRKLLLVTGRRLDDLLSTFFHPEAFDLIVAENGALLYEPSTQREEILAEPLRPDFAEMLERKGVRPLERGRVIVATLELFGSAIHGHRNDLSVPVNQLGRVRIIKQVNRNRNALTQPDKRAGYRSVVSECRDGMPFCDIGQHSADPQSHIGRTRRRGCWQCTSTRRPGSAARSEEQARCDGGAG
jgi:hypothetical protein